MIVNKKDNTHNVIGIIIGFFFLIFGTFGIVALFGDGLGQTALLSLIFTFGFIGAGFIAINISILSIRNLAKRTDDTAAKLNPVTKIVGMGVITKVKGFFVIRFGGYYVNILQMHERIDYNPSLIRKIMGPKLPTIFPIKCPVATEYHGHQIRKCQGTAKIYDPEKKKWILGQTTMYSLNYLIKSITDLLEPNEFQNLIYSLKQDIIPKK
jgi:hypothetical protein